MRRKVIVVLILFVIGFFIYTKYSEIDNAIMEEYEPKFKINELYNSKEINYRYLLNDKEKLLYEKFINAIINFDTEIVLDLSFNKHSSSYAYIENAQKINDSVIMDHPELIQYAYPAIYNDVENGKVRLKLYYALNKSDYNKYVAIIDKELNNISNDVKDMSTYEKIKYTYEYLGNKNTYGDTSDKRSQSAYTAFIDGINPVCSGYARASQLIFSKIGVNSLLVTGDLKSTWLIGDSHEWNVVKVGNSYYNYDVTQSSVFKSFKGSVSYMGLFSMPKSSFSLRYDGVTPYLKNNKLDYYKNNSLHYKYKSSNINKLQEILSSSNDEYIEIKMSNITGFKMSYKDIKDKLGIADYRVVDDIIVFKKL